MKYLRRIALSIILASRFSAHAQVLSQIWTAIYDGPSNQADVPRDDDAAAVAVDRTGNIAVTGRSRGADGTFEICTVKYSGVTGARLWERRYARLEAFSKGVAFDSHGNVFVVGYLGLDPDHYYTAKYAAADGELLWEAEYDGVGDGEDFGAAIAVDAHDDVIVTGNSSGSVTDGQDIVTVKYSGANGAQIWERRNENAGNDQVKALALDKMGNVIVSGSVFNRTDTDFYTAKYAAADGALIWERRYRGPGLNDDPGGVAIDKSGHVIVTGTSANAQGDTDIYTAKYDAATGSLIWETRYDYGGRTDTAAAVTTDDSESVYIVGSSQNATIASNFDYYTAKYSPSGVLVWERRYVAGGNAKAFDIGVNRNGNVFVTGQVIATSISGYLTVEYSAMGSLIWAQNYLGQVKGLPGARMDRTPSIGDKLSVLPDGGIVITGQSYSASSWDYATIRYSPADKTPPTFSMPKSLIVEATSAAGAVVNYAASASDNLYLVSSSFTPASGTGFPLGETTVNALATDYAGQTARSSFEVSVRDTTPPAFTAFPDPVVVEAVDANGTVVEFSATAVDTVSSVMVRFSPESGTKFPIGRTDVSVSAYDASGNSNIRWFSVTVQDTTPPVIAGDFSPLVIWQGTPVPDFTKQATGIDQVGGITLVQTGATIAETPGQIEVTVHASDSAGNESTRAVFIDVVPRPLSVAATGQPVSSNGIRIPIDAVWAGFGSPAVNQYGDVAFVGKWKSRQGNGEGLFMEDGVGSPHLIVAIGDPLPAIPGASWKRLRAPVYSYPQTVAWVGTVERDGRSEDVAVLYKNGALTILAQHGRFVNGLSGCILDTIRNIDLATRYTDAVVIDAGLKIGSGFPRVNARTSRIGFLWFPEAGLYPEFRADDAVRRISFMLPAFGQGRNAESARLVWETGAQYITPSYYPYELGSGLPTNMRSVPDSYWNRIGLPSDSAFRARLIVGGDVTKANAVGIFRKAQEVLEPLIRTGDPAPDMGDGAVFTELGEPVAHGESVAFIGKAAGGKVTAGNNSGIWWAHSGAPLRLIAREASQPPGAPAGARWNRFTSLALTERGPLFKATLVRGHGGVTGANDTGLYSHSSSGSLIELLRKGGNYAEGKRILSFTTQSPALGCVSASRQFNVSGTSVAHVTFTDHSTAIVRFGTEHVTQQ